MSPFYVTRQLIEPGPLLEWSRSVGLPAKRPPALHLTIAYSRVAADWRVIEPEAEELSVGGDRRALKALAGGALALMVDCPAAVARHNHLRRLGASWDYPGFSPHVTLAYGDWPLSMPAPHAGPLLFGPEIFRRLT